MKKGLMSLLVISLLLLSTALLSEAIDSVGTIPNLNLGKEKTEPEGIGKKPLCSFNRECKVEDFMNETEKIAILRIRGISGTKYLRAVVYEKYSDGSWAIPEYPLKPYQGEYIPPWVRSYNNELDRAIKVIPFVNISGYIPTVLNLEKLDSDATLEYNTDIRVFFSETPFDSEYSLSYKIYFYEMEMLDLAQVVDDPKNLEIPVKIADKISLVVEEAIGNAKTPYGKVMSIISYLQENYTYDPDYPRAPKGVDPVVWFLTASKRGVCTQFNSALVLLARSIGVPARLVGGFLINSEMDAQLVFQDQKHAYAEISFEKLGWIIFDATPSAGCSQCESLEKGEEDKEERVDTCEPVDAVFNQSECKNCINNCSKMSPEGGAGPNVDLFEVFGVTGINYLRTTVGEQYDGLWSMSQPYPQRYGGESISYDVSGFIKDTSHTFMISPLTHMGGFIPTTLYTSELRLDSTIQRYPDQQIFFSSDIFDEPYTLSYTIYKFADATLQSATPLRDQRYMNVPDDLVERLRELAVTATSGAETPYEKLKALEAYLKMNYVYNLNYTRAPLGVDPVEWFLFQEKRGVCANFNSAFVLLARSMGLPARLVGGYVIDPEVEMQVVNARQGHSYSEVPFEGIGWITFDATAPAVRSDRVDGGEGDIEPVEKVYNRTDSEDCVCSCTKMDPEGGMPPNIDIFRIYGVTGTTYLRTMVGESYDGIWEMSEVSPEAYKGGLITYDVSGYDKILDRRFIISPLVDMGGFIVSALYTKELKIGWTIQRYPDQQIFFSPIRFNSTYTVSHTKYEFDSDTLREATPLSDSRYLNIPSELVMKLRPLAFSVTSGVESPFEKLVALKEFLQSNYEYDINYTRAPDGFDPVEWFLFHEKRGVCANFNSAFVLLARAIGLPARFVGGYIIDPDAERQVVNARQGHSYSEVPFEGIGWITFDATVPGQLPEEVPAEEIETVINTSTEITEQDPIGVRGFTFRVFGEVKDENGESVDGLQTLIYLKETKEEDGLLVGEGPVVEGIFNVTCILPLNISNGYYLIQAHTLGDYGYNGSWSDPPLKVVTKTDIILSMPEKMIAGRPFSFQGNLTEHMTEEPIAHAICIMMMGLEETRFETDDNGYFEGSYMLTEPGEYSFSLEWSGSEYYIGSITSTSVRIVPLTITPVEIEMMVRKEEAIISGRVHAEELPGDNEYVVISFDGQEIGTANTGEDGSFVFKHVVPRTQELGEVQLGYYLKSNSYTTSQQSAVYARTHIELNAPDYLSVKKPFNIDTVLTDDLANPIGNARLILESDETGQRTNTTTNADGTKELSLKIMDVPATESISYSVSYDGSGYYLESTSSVSLKVMRPMMPKIDVITTVTNTLILLVLCLVGYTVFVIIRKRMRKECAVESAEPPEEQVEPEPEEKRQVVGIIRSNERLLFEFPQIVDPFPLVWGSGEELVVRLGLSKVEGESGESSEVQLVVDGVEGPAFTLVVDQNIDHALTFVEKGYHRIKARFMGVDTLEAACEAVVKIVDYREEVNDLFNEEFEEYKGTREEIKTHFTAREFMHTILEGLSDKLHGPLNEMVTVFEIADYSQHDIRRREYERFYTARREFEGVKIGK